MRLTDDIIRRRKRPAQGQLILWDDLVAGFGVRLTPARPDSATFVVQWRESENSKPRESLRPLWPTLSVMQAREAARKRLGEVTATRGSAASESLRVAIRRWYERMTETQAWRPRYRAKVDALISTYIESVPNVRVKLTASARSAVDELGRKSVGSVTRTDVLRVADAIKPGSADQLMAQISAFYNWAFDRGVEIPNPARNRLKVTGGRRLRHRTFSDAEFLTLWHAIEKEGDPAAGAFMMLALTGTRRREVTQMPWLELDLERQTWTLPPERRKTGRKDPEPFIIHLHSAAIAILKRQPVLEGNPHVFWGRRDQRPFDFHHALIERLNEAGVKDWRLHDLRRYMRSGLSRLGVQQVVAEMCLGHVAKSGLVAVYDQHAYLNEKRAAWQKWGDYVAQLVGEPQS
jgi:integrase